MMFFRLLAAVTVWFCLIQSIHAQISSATISGTVRDSSGAAIEGVRVIARNVGTNIEHAAVTNGEGSYVIPSAGIGNYVVSAEKQGFRREVRSGIELVVDQRARVDFELLVGQVYDSVTIMGEVPLVDSESSAVGQVIDNKRVVELPLNGRNFIQLAALSPGAITRWTWNSQFTGEPDVNVNGNRGGATGFQIDGAENFEQNAQTVQISPSIETIQEFKVQSSTFSAESGRQAAVISVVTKSGTNQFRGNLFEFVRNREFDARNFFSRESRAEDLKRNQFGGTFGGPVIKNRLFFFGAYEGTRQRLASVRNSLTVTQAQREGNLQGLPAIFDPATTNATTRVRQPFPNNIIPANRLNQAALGVLKIIPLPNAPGDRYIVNSISKLTSNQYNFRADHRIGDRDTYFFRITQDHRFQEVPGPFPVVGGDDQDVFSLNGILSYTHTFAPNKLNEFRFSGSRFHLQFNTLDKDVKAIDALGIKGLEGRTRESIEGYPILNVTGYGNFGDIAIRPLEQRFNTFNWVDTFTWIKGGHTLKFGLDARRYQRAAFNGINARGNFSFTGALTQNPAEPGGTGAGLADFLLGLPNSATRNFPRLRQQIFWTNLSSFVQDDWKISPRLTLNVGLRHEFNGQPFEKRNRIGSFDFVTGRPIAASGTDGKIDQDAFIFFTQQELDYLGVSTAQSLGFPRRALRENQYNSFAPRIGFSFNPFGAGKTVLRGGYGIFYTLVGGNLSTQNIGSVPFFRGETFTNNPLTPTLTFENAFPPGTALPVPDIFAFQKDFHDSYVQEWSFNIQRQLDRNTVVEVGYVGGKGSHLDISYQANQPLVPGAGAIQSRRPYPKFATIQFNTTEGYSNYHALQARAERRFSSGFTFLAAYTFSKAIGMFGDSQNPANLNDGKAVTDYDVPHRFVFSTVYDLPFGRGRRFLQRGGVLGTIVAGWQLGNILTLQSGFPFTPVTGRDIANVGLNTRPNRIAKGTVAHPTIDRWFDASAFTNPAALTYGTSGVNILRQDGFKDLTSVLSKNFAIHESMYVQFRWEVFNVFNHANFAAPNANINQPTQVGRVFSASAPRIMQLGLKLFF